MYYVFMYVYMHVLCMYVCMYVCIYVCMYVFMYVCMYVCVCVCVCVYILSTFSAAWRTVALLLRNLTTATQQSTNGKETQMPDPVLYRENIPDL